MRVGQRDSGAQGFSNEVYVNEGRRLQTVRKLRGDRYYGGTAVLRHMLPRSTAIAAQYSCLLELPQSRKQNRGLGQVLMSSGSAGGEKTAQRSSLLVN